MLQRVLISSVEYIPSTSISKVIPIKKNNLYKVDVTFRSELENLHIHGLAELNVKEDTENGEKRYISQLSFSSKCHQLREERQGVYVLTTISGERLLIGLNEHPFPVTTQEQPRPADPSGKVMRNEVVVWTSPYPPLEIM